MPVTQSGIRYPFDLTPGQSGSMSLGTVDNVFGYSGTSDNNTADVTVTPTNSNMSSIWYFLLVAAILVVIKFLVEHEKSGVQPVIMGVGVYNFIVITLIAILGIAGFKVIFNKYQVPGLTTLVNAV